MTFIENLGRFLDVVGPTNGDVAWWLAGVDWPSDAAREDFITAMSLAGPNEPGP